MTLPEASCSDCADTTSAFELKVLKNLWGFSRVQMGIPSRRPKKQPTHGAIVDENDVPVGQIPIEELPALMMQFLYPYPSSLLGIAPMADIGGRISMAPLRRDATAKVSKLVTEKKRAKLNAGGIASDSFARMLAKIGHAYAVAELGLEKFTPTLPSSILTKEAPHIHHYVGSGDIDMPRVDRLHEIELEIHRVGSIRYAVVRIRFFARHTDRYHFVVAGVLNEPTTAPVGDAAGVKRAS